MKYFFFDIDGTLTDIHTAKLVPSGLETLRKLEAKGNFVAICTGRAYYKTVKDAAAAGVHNLVANGGAALVINDKLVRNAPLEKEKALRIIHQAEDLGYGVLVAIDDSIKVVMRNHTFLDQVGQRKEPTEYLYQPDLVYEDLANIYKFYISIPADREDELTLRDELGHIRFVQEYLCYQHDEKDRGIFDMIEYLGGNISDVVVFGDGENDMIMFRPEWTSIAMGNGYPPLLAKADYVTDAAEDDGIRNACLHFGWIDE
ncbi:MAG: HAD-IIB family hydrolase [Solobacterium sp.]|nr:HAD-IIB family hydrolase [Solobacterium sp.]